MSKRVYWFDYKEEAISGWQYLLRMFISGMLLLFVIPGIILATSSVFKRASTLQWPYNLRILATILIPLNVLTGVYDDYFLGQILDGSSMTSRYIYIIISLAITGIHLALLFSNRPKPHDNELKLTMDESVLNAVEQNISVTDKRYERLKKKVIESFGNQLNDETLDSSVNGSTITPPEIKIYEGIEDVDDKDITDLAGEELRLLIETDESEKDKIPTKIVRSKDRFHSDLSDEWSE